MVDLALGTDVDPARGVETEQGAHIVGHPARDGHLLLVAAGQAPHLALGTRVDLEALDGTLDAALLVAHVDDSPAARPGPLGQGDVLPHGALHEEGLGTIARHVDKTCRDGIGRVTEACLLTVHEERPA